MFLESQHPPPRIPSSDLRLAKTIGPWKEINFQFPLYCKQKFPCVNRNYFSPSDKQTRWRHRSVRRQTVLWALVWRLWTNAYLCWAALSNTQTQGVEERGRKGPWRWIGSPNQKVWYSLLLASLGTFWSSRKGCNVVTIQLSSECLKQIFRQDMTK